MTTLKKQPLHNAMAFFHQNGLALAWKQAMRFAEKGGRLATLPDIIAARIANKPDRKQKTGNAAWEMYFTTLTAEYFGISKTGKHILIVAHGIGPLSTLAGIEKAYSWQYLDKDRDRRGGRITQQEFLDLEAGKYGEVSIIDLDSYVRRYAYPFLETLETSDALTDPLLKARLGPQAEEYLRLHRDIARVWHMEQASFDPENIHQLPDYQQRMRRRRLRHLRDAHHNSDPYIIEVKDAANCCYTFGSALGFSPGLEFGYRPIEDGYAIAHLISIGQLVNLRHEGNESLVTDVSCHEWWNGVRLVGIKANGDIRTNLHPGPDAYGLIRRHWPDLLMPVKNPQPVGFHALVKIGEQWFTQYPKAGERMDTYEPEHVVTAIKTVGEPTIFRTTVGSYEGFFKFGLNEVRAIAPPGANAYSFVEEPLIEVQDGSATHHTCHVQFYWIKADTSERLVRANDLANDFDTMMALIAKEVGS